MKIAKLKKRFLSMLLALVLALGVIPMTSINVDAAFGENYVSQIGVATSSQINGAGKAKKILTSNDYFYIDKDLNENQGGKYIYAGYKTSKNYKDAITGIIIRVGKNPPEKITYNNCDFYLLGGEKEKNVADEGKVDLNTGAGGEYLYLYITRESKFGSPIVDLNVSVNPYLDKHSPVTDTSGNSKYVNDKQRYYFIYRSFSSMPYAKIRLGVYYVNENGQLAQNSKTATMSNPDEKFYPNFNVPTDVVYKGMNLKLLGWNSTTDYYDFNVTYNEISFSVSQGNWFRDEEATQYKVFSSIYSQKVNLSYDANGGDVTPNSQSITRKIKVNSTGAFAKEKDAEFTITDRKPTKNGACAFLGWSTDKSATEATYKAGDKVKLDVDTTLYAVYDEHDFEYSASDNVITQTCENCGHKATASLVLNPDISLEYTGKGVFPLKVEYSDNWIGDRNAEIQYYDGSYTPGQHTGAVYIGAWAFKTFEIAKGNMKGIVAENYSGAYDGEEHGITVKGYPDTGAAVTYSTSENGNYSQNNPTFTDVGTYTVYYKVEKDNFNTVKGSATVTISQGQNSWEKEPSISNRTYGNSSEPYEGKPKFGYDVRVEYKTEGANDSEYTTEIPLQAGKYTARFSVEGTENYASLKKEINFEIEKAEITVKADDFSKTYGEKDPKFTWSITDGKLAYNDRLTGIPVSREAGEDAKTYTITVNQSNGANSNYEITFVDGTFTIGKKTIGISWGNSNFTYDGETKLPTATATGTEFNDEIGLTVEGGRINAGTGYIATVMGITGDKKDNYLLPAGVTTTFNVAKADQVAPGGLVGTAESVDGKADGIIIGLTDAMEYRMNDETTYTVITGGELANLADGTYCIRYREDINHNASPETKIVLSNDTKLTVTVPKTQTGYTLTVSNNALKWNESTTLNFAIKDGYSKLDAFAVKVNCEPITLDNDGKYTIANVTENLTVTVEGVADITAPDTEITLGTSKWNKFWNNVTFGLFFNDTQKVTVTASDKGSGVDNDKIYYYLATEALTEEQVKSLDGWTKYEGAFNINPQEEYVIYVKASDKDCNTRYICSEYGIVIDSIAPQISGIANGETHYGDTQFTVTDKHIDVVTVDGTSVLITADGKYTIKADGKEHTVTAKDKSGNASAEIKVTVITIASLDDSIENITVDNVKSSDKKAIEDVQSFVNALIDSGKDFTDEEDAELAGIKENTENLLKKTDEVAGEIKDITDSVNGYDIDKVKSDDRQDIQDFVDRIDILLETDNVTDTEKSALEEVKATANDLIGRIDDTASDKKDLTDAVNGYDKDTVTSDDKKGIEDLIDEIDKLLDGDNLNGSEKEELEKVKDTAEDLIDKIEEASNSSNTENTEEVKDITEDNVMTDDKDDLEKAKEDLEKTLEDYKDNLTDEEKKDIENEIERIDKALDVIDRVEKVEDLINKLPEAITKADTEDVKAADNAYKALSKYEVSVLDKNAKEKLDRAKAQLAELSKAETSSQTGDDSHMVLWFSLLIVSGGIIGVAFWGRRKKYFSK